MTMLRNRSASVTLAVAGAIALMTAKTRAQEPEPKPTSTTTPPAPAVAPDPAESPAPKTVTPYRRVPSYFGRVGLSNQQREDIYVIRGRYQAEIAELRARIEALTRQEMDECESVLTEAQRRLLQQFRTAARPPLVGNTAIDD
jgi:hypothetical protein